MEARAVQKSLPEHATTLGGWSEAIYLYAPTSFPSGATSG
jgi:hypothetical protein